MKSATGLAKTRLAAMGLLLFPAITWAGNRTAAGAATASARSSTWIAVEKRPTTVVLDSSDRRLRMFAKFFSTVLLAVVVLSPTLPLSAQNWVVYDDFKGSSINPARWVSTGLGVCQNALECERQIQGGQLRLWIRGYGLTTPTGLAENWSQNGLEVSPSELAGITGIGAKLTLTRAISNGGPDVQIGVMGLRAVFFNSGLGAPSDWSNDVQAHLFMYPHSDQTISVGGYLCCKLNTRDRIGPNIVELGSVNVGESVTVSVRWDKVNKQVVYGLQRLGQPPQEGRISYGGTTSDAVEPWHPYKQVQLETGPPNNKSPLVFSDMEAKVDQVTVFR
jgi:hypothetical protein